MKKLTTKTHAKQKHKWVDYLNLREEQYKKFEKTS